MACEDLHGLRFGRLTVVDKDNSNLGRAKWNCICDCGTFVSVYASNLKRGTSRSCGCLQKEELSKRKTTHGGWAKDEPLYAIWAGMKKRCNSEYHPNHKHYGGRGISLCDEWYDYANFRAWSLSAGYKNGLSIDRINVNGNYEPQNCRWATTIQQQNNRRSCRYFTLNGETLTIKQWASMFGISYQTLYSYLFRHGFSQSAFERYISDKNLHCIRHQRSSN